MSFRSNDKINYNDVTLFRSRVEQIGLEWVEVKEVDMKKKYSLYLNLALQMHRADPDLDLLDHEIKESCIEYLSEHRRVGEVEWRSLISQETYMKRHRRDTDVLLWDDLILLAFVHVYRQPLRIVERDRIVSVRPSGGETSLKAPLLIGKVSKRHFASVEVRQPSKLPDEADDEEFVVDGKSLKRTKQPPEVPATAHVNSTIQDEQTELIKRKANARNMEPEYPEEEFSSDDDTHPGDPFIEEPPEDEDRTGGWVMKLLTKIFKLLSYLVFFALVFAGALVSKSCILVLANAARPTGETDVVTSSGLQRDFIRSWALVFMTIALGFPELLTFCYSCYRVLLKREDKLLLSTAVLGIVLDLIPCVGEAILFMIVLPHTDATTALLMLSMITLIPSLINLHAKWVSLREGRRRGGEKRRIREKFYDLLCAVTSPLLLLIAFAFLICITMGTMKINNSNVSFPYVEMVDNGKAGYGGMDKVPMMVLTVIGLVLVSVRHWENFVTCNWFLLPLRDIHERMEKCRFKIALVSSLIKMGLLVGMMFLTMDVIETDSYYSSKGSDVFKSDFFSQQSKRSPLPHREITRALMMVLITQACSSLASFFFGRVACMTMVQVQSYSLPLALVTPAIASVSAALNFYKIDTSYAHPSLWSFMGIGNPKTDLPYIGSYIDWNTMLVGVNRWELAVLVLVGVLTTHLSLLLLTFFLWKPQQGKIERTEVLFVKTIYAGPLIDQHLILNRRNYQEQYNKIHESTKPSNNNENINDNNKPQKQRRYTKTNSKRNTPHLFLCTTMWHETEQEMTQMLTSLMRMDLDESRRRGKKDGEVDKYTFNVHILFDDAFEKRKGATSKVPNKFVNQLCRLVPLAANKVERGKGFEMSPPVIYPTPYGARLEFLLPNNNMMFVHLKDKDRIRHRKRWSQCMYMYYILGFLHKTKNLKKLKDIFILALDGDVDFQPNSVLALMDRMLRNDRVGAACGRIHPVGSGPVVWFQKFEYAVGHWLQKTTEHVLGCVLCSPGCFSMFRGEALVDINVIKTYTTRPTEALHYVQWDQGEDRWLCTLLLKRGWRIEYSAASDSFTFAPEDFKEFYNQRRRWGPSTMANIFDILADSRITVKNNMYISWGYVIYQASLMISSVLGPATVIMMVSQSYSYIFNWTATVGLIVSLVPVIVYIILCYTTSQDTQVAVAAILTIVYALVMMTVLVGVVGSMASSTLLDPNNLFYVVLAGLYIFTALLHPQELSCLMHGLLYYLCVPSAFIFLMVYSLNNMDNVSWGTREVKKPDEAPPEPTVDQVAQSMVNKQQGIISIPGQKTDLYDAHRDTDSYYKCGLGNLCQCAMCIQPVPGGHYMPVSQQAVTAQPSHRPRIATAYRRKTKTKQQLIEEFSRAKEFNTGEDANAIKRRMTMSITPKEAKKMMDKSEVEQKDLTTGKLRRLSRRQTRESKIRRVTAMNKTESAAHTTAQNLHDELENNSLMGFNDEDYDDESVVESEIAESEAEDPKEGDEGESIGWLLDGELENSQIDYIEEEEKKFWQYIINRYLYPLDEDENEKKRIKSDLVGLRNKVTGGYYFANALWLVLNFALQLAITDVAIVFVIQGSVIKLNPVSLVFLLFFVIVLFVQFGCMVMHRWSTALHVLANTSVRWNAEDMGIVKNLTKKEISEAEKEHERKKKLKQVQKDDPFGLGDPNNDYESIEMTDVEQQNNVNYKSAYTNQAYVDENDDDGDSGNVDSVENQSYPGLQQQFGKFGKQTFYPSMTDSTHEQPRDSPLHRKSTVIDQDLFASDNDDDGSDDGCDVTVITPAKPPTPPKARRKTMGETLVGAAAASAASGSKVTFAEVVNEAEDDNLIDDVTPL